MGLVRICSRGRKWWKLTERDPTLELGKILESGRGEEKEKWERKEISNFGAWKESGEIDRERFCLGTYKGSTDRGRKKETLGVWKISRAIVKSDTEKKRNISNKSFAKL